MALRDELALGAGELVFFGAAVPPARPRHEGTWERDKKKDKKKKKDAAEASPEALRSSVWSLLREAQRGQRRLERGRGQRA